MDPDRKAYRQQIILVALPLIMANTLIRPVDWAAEASILADKVEAEEAKREQ